MNSLAKCLNTASKALKKLSALVQTLLDDDVLNPKQSKILIGDGKQLHASLRAVHDDIKAGESAHDIADGISDLLDAMSSHGASLDGLLGLLDELQADADTWEEIQQGFKTTLDNPRALYCAPFAMFSSISKLSNSLDSPVRKALSSLRRAVQPYIITARQQIELLELEAEFAPDQDIGEPLCRQGRRLVRKGRLQRMTPEHEMEESEVWLFNDMLVCCVDGQGADGGLEVEGVMELGEGAKCDPVVSKESGTKVYAVCLLSDEGYGYTFVAQGQQEQQEWNDDICAVIAQESPMSPPKVGTSGGEDNSPEDEVSGDSIGASPRGRSAGQRAKEHTGEYSEGDDANDFAGDDQHPQTRDGLMPKRNQEKTSAAPSQERFAAFTDHSGEQMGGTMAAAPKTSNSQSSPRSGTVTALGLSSLLQRSETAASAVSVATSVSNVVSALPSTDEVQQIASMLMERNLSERIRAMKRGCVLVKYNIRNGLPGPRFVRLSRDGMAIEWAHIGSSRFKSKLYLKDVISLRHSPSIKAQIVKRGSDAAFLTFSLVLSKHSLHYQKTSRKQRQAAENHFAGIESAGIAPVHSPALTLAARKGIDLMDWYIGLQHLFHKQGIVDLDVTPADLAIRVASEEPNSISDLRRLREEEKHLERDRAHEEQFAMEEDRRKMMRERYGLLGSLGFGRGMGYGYGGPYGGGFGATSKPYDLMGEAEPEFAASQPVGLFGAIRRRFQGWAGPSQDFWSSRGLDGGRSPRGSVGYGRGRGMYEDDHYSPRGRSRSNGRYGSFSRGGRYDDYEDYDEYGRRSQTRRSRGSRGRWNANQEDEEDYEQGSRWGRSKSRRQADRRHRDSYGGQFDDYSEDEERGWGRGRSQSNRRAVSRGRRGRAWRSPSRDFEDETSEEEAVHGNRRGRRDGGRSQSRGRSSAGDGVSQKRGSVRSSSKGRQSIRADDPLSDDEEIDVKPSRKGNSRSLSRAGRNGQRNGQGDDSFSEEETAPRQVQSNKRASSSKRQSVAAQSAGKRRSAAADRKSSSFDRLDDDEGVALTPRKSFARPPPPKAGWRPYMAEDQKEDLRDS